MPRAAAAHALPLLPGEMPPVSAPVPYSTPNLPFNGVVLVGEAPGAEEARLGQAFVGRSGQLLNTALAAAGLERAACVVANVFRVRPPANAVTHFFASKRAAQAAGVVLAEDLPRFGSLWLCEQWRGELLALQTMLRQVQPRLVVALGRTPLWALTGQEGLLQKVGQQLPGTLYAGCSVLATYHPSFILRGNWGLQPRWTEHLAQANFVD